MNDNITAREAAKSKIAKLMAVATDGRGNENEAETAMRMAEAMMRKHGIEAGELCDHTGKRPVYEWSTVLVPLDPQRRGTSAIAWVGQLSLSVARYTDTIAEYARNPEWGMCIAYKGEVADVEFAVWLTKTLRDYIRNGSAAFAGTRAEREDWRKACVSRIGNRMNALRRERDTAMQQASSTGTALVLVTEKLALVAQQFGKQRVRNTRGRAAGSYGREHGAAAGDRAPINRPVGHSGGQRLIGG